MLIASGLGLYVIRRIIMLNWVVSESFVDDLTSQTRYSKVLELPSCNDCLKFSLLFACFVFFLILIKGLR